MPRFSTGSFLLFAFACAPFAFFCACNNGGGEGPAARPDAADGTDGAPGGDGKEPDGSLADVGVRECPPASSLSPVIPTTPLTGSVANREFPLAGKTALARPIASLAGFYSVEISEGKASCSNPDGGTRGVRLVLPGDGRTCAASSPVQADFFHVRAEGAPASAPSSYVRPAGTEGVVTAKPAGSNLSVGMIVGAFASDGLPADGLSGTAAATVCP